VAAWNELPATGGLDECAALVHSAETLRFSAPELAVQLAHRALRMGASVTGADPGIARPLSMRAQAVLAAGLVSISHHVEAVAPAAAALAFAERGGAPEVAAAMRLELAACAREVGEPLVGSGVLRPVLVDDQVRPSVRGRAIGRLVGCVAPVVRRDDVEDAIVEADRLFAADDGLTVDDRRLERARLAVRTAAYHRWYGDVEDAIEVSRDGLGLLARVRDQEATSGRLRARLVLELVCALLDNGELEEAESVARPVMDEPVRATSALPVGRIMLAVSTRVHLPGGRVDLGRCLLDQVVRLAERHGLDSLLADALTTVSQLDERADRLAESLAALQSARAAEQRRLLGVAKASRALLTEVDHGGRRGATVAAANALLRQVLKPAEVAPAPQATEITQQITAVPAAEAPGRDTDAATGLLNGDGLARRLRAARAADRPLAMTLVRLDHGEHDRGRTRDLTELANQVRSLAPAGAELARPAGAELAVLLPHTTLDQAEQLASTIGRTAVESADANGRVVAVSTGAAQSGENTDALLTAARAALTPTERPTSEERHTTPAEHAAEANGTPIRRGLDLAGARESLTVGRSILNSLSIPSGSGGRRRAAQEEAAESAAPPARHQEPAADARTNYEMTKDELTRMMSALSAGTLRVPPSPTAGARNGTRVADRDRTVRQTLPTPPQPDDVPTPPTRPEVPDPAEPTPVPQPPPEPTDPRPDPDSRTPSWQADSAPWTPSSTADELAALWNGPSSLPTRAAPPDSATADATPSPSFAQSTPSDPTATTPPPWRANHSSPTSTEPATPGPTTSDLSWSTHSQPSPTDSTVPGSMTSGSSWSTHSQPSPTDSTAPGSTTSGSSWSTHSQPSPTDSTVPGPTRPGSSWSTHSEPTPTDSAPGSTESAAAESFWGAESAGSGSAEGAADTSSWGGRNGATSRDAATFGSAAEDSAAKSLPWRTGTSSPTDPAESTAAESSWETGRDDADSRRSTPAAGAAASSPSWTGSSGGAAHDAATSSSAAADSTAADSAEGAAPESSRGVGRGGAAAAESSGFGSAEGAAAHSSQWRTGSSPASGDSAEGSAAQSLPRRTGHSRAASADSTESAESWNARRSGADTFGSGKRAVADSSFWGTASNGFGRSDSTATSASSNTAESATRNTDVDLSALWARSETSHAAKPETRPTASDADLEVANELAALWARTTSRSKSAAGSDTASESQARRQSTVPPPAPRAPSVADARPEPDDIPRAERSDSTTIAGLLAEALAAYQSSVDEEQARASAPKADPIAEFQQRTGAAGRHRSPE
jgi:GGDEF domain-containing protein